MATMKLHVGSPKCPICGSTKVKGYKVHNKGRWWHRCISDVDHGEYQLPDGKHGEFEQYPYFDDEGFIETAHGDVKIGYQERV